MGPNNTPRENHKRVLRFFSFAKAKQATPQSRQIKMTSNFLNFDILFKYKGINL